MSLEMLGIFVFLAAASAAITGIVRRASLRHGAMDIPNERSSHVRPTARGGGIAIVFVSLAGMGVLAWFGWIETRLFYALAGGGAAVALVGHLDDRGLIGIVGRFTVHIGAAIWATLWLGGMSEIQWGENVVRLGYLGS